MNARLKIFIFLVTYATICLGQNQDNSSKPHDHELTIEAGAFYTPLLNSNAFGFTGDFKFYFHKKLSTGICGSQTNKKINEEFQFTIEQPIIYYFGVGWINQYDIIQNNKFRLALNLNNGFAQTELGDKSIKKGEKTKIISTNNFYLLEPGLDIKIRLFKNKLDPSFYFYAKTKYRFLFGNTNYGKTTDFANYYISFGISIIDIYHKKGRKGSR